MSVAPEVVARTIIRAERRRRISRGFVEKQMSLPPHPMSDARQAAEQRGASEEIATVPRVPTPPESDLEHDAPAVDTSGAR